MTRHVVTYDLRMSRWRPGAQQRLAAAALELFTEQGFANTTVPQITARAGLTTRTFFRHFADKREVLFEAGGDMPALIRAQMAAAPPGLDPMTLIEAGLREVASTGSKDYTTTYAPAAPSSAAITDWANVNYANQPSSPTPSPQASNDADCTPCTQP